MHICNFRTQYGMGLVQTANKGYWQNFGSHLCIFCVTFMPAPRVFSARTCVCFANNKSFFDNQRVTFSRLDKCEKNF